MKNKPKYKLYLRPPENNVEVLKRLLSREKIIFSNYGCILTINEKPINKSAIFDNLESYEKYKKEKITIYEKIKTQLYDNGGIYVIHGQTL